MKINKLIVLMALVSLFMLSFALASEEGTTYVNITNTAPVVTGDIQLNDNTLGDDSMTLTAGTTTTIYCNGTITDGDGLSDIDSVNSTIWSSNSAYANSDNNTNHYTNSSCFYESVDGNFSCTFDVLFYADNTSWTCQVNANDSFGATASNTDAANLEALTAFDMQNGLALDFGDMAVGDSKTGATFNASFNNTGNVAIDIQVDAWDLTTPNSGSSFAMNCSDSGSIAIGDFKASLTNGAFGTYTSMSQAGYITLPANLGRQVSGTAPTKEDYVYFGLEITGGARGVCQGVVSLEVI